MGESSRSRWVDELVARVRELTDEERRIVAAARKAVDESYHERALVAAAEALVGRAEEYAHARRELARAHVPHALARGEPLTETERQAWNEDARLVQLALDDALAALVASDALHPNHLRELYRSLKALAPE